VLEFRHGTTKLNTHLLLSPLQEVLSLALKTVMQNIYIYRIFIEILKEDLHLLEIGKMEELFE
jgi:hypothetical protein